MTRADTSRVSTGCSTTAVAAVAAVAYHAVPAIEPVGGERVKAKSMI